jgi:hypothetical protein
MILLNGDTIFRQKILSFSCFLLLPQCQTNLRIVHWSLPRIKSLEQFLNYYISSVNCGNIYIHSVLLFCTVYGKFIIDKKSAPFCAPVHNSCIMFTENHFRARNRVCTVFCMESEKYISWTVHRYSLSCCFELTPGGKPHCWTSTRGYLLIIFQHCSFLL